MKCYNDAKMWYLNSIIMQVCGRSTRQWLWRRLFRHRQHLTELPHGHCQVWGISWILLKLYSFGHFSLSFEHFTMSGWRWRTRLENQKRQKLFKSDVSKILILKFRNVSSFYEKCSILFELKTENMKICHRLLLKVGKYLDFWNQNFTGDHCMKSLFTFLLWLPPDRRGVVDRSK